MAQSRALWPIGAAVATSKPLTTPSPVSAMAAPSYEAHGCASAASAWMHRSGRPSASTRATTARAFATRGYRCVAANPASNETLLGVGGAAAEEARSEEHTSELQSLRRTSYA